MALLCVRRCVSERYVPETGVGRRRKGVGGGGWGGGVEPEAAMKDHYKLFRGGGARIGSRLRASLRQPRPALASRL